MSKCEWDEYGASRCLMTADMSSEQIDRELSLGNKADKADEDRAEEYNQNTADNRAHLRYWRPRK